jgi:hypothetical protein
VLSVLGVLVACIVIATDVRVTVLPQSAPFRRAKRAAAAGLVAGALPVTVMALVFLLPWLKGMAAEEDAQVESRFAASWIAPLITTVPAVVGFAVLGGFAIGALRPLGKYSGALLLPFAPWLLTGSAPFVVPALDTMMFRGQAGLAGTSLRRSVLPVLPAAGIAVVGFWLLQAQDFLWSQIMSKPDSSTTPAAFVRSVSASGLRNQSQQRLIEGFKACVHERPAATDPTKVPDSCQVPNGQPGADQLQQMLTGAGLPANAHNFSRTFGVTLWYGVGLLVVVCLGIFALPRKVRAARDLDAELAALERQHAHNAAAPGH